ncbi:MAG: histidine kinase [Vicingaceae bacterium]
MKTQLLIFVFCLITAVSAFSQKLKLKEVIHLPDTSELKKEALESDILSAKKYMTQNTDSSIIISKQLIKLCEENEYNFGLGRSLSINAWFLLTKERFNDAVETAMDALEVQKLNRDTAGMALTLNRLGLVYFEIERPNTGGEYLKRSLEYGTAINDTSIIEMVLNNLGVYSENYLESINYYKRSLKYRIEQGKYFWVAYSYFNISDAFMMAKELDSADHYMKLAHNYFLNKTKKGTIPYLAKVGTAELYLKQGRFKQAQRFAEEGLNESLSTGQTDIIVWAKKILAEVLYAQGNYKEAYDTLQSYLELQREIDSTNNLAAITEIEKKYKTAEKEAEISRLEKENLEKEMEAKKSQMWAFYSFTGSGALLLFFLLFWKKSKQKQKLKSAELQSKISETRMMALRAQMNPHFIFNCINTAQHHVLHSGEKTAFEYLSKFSTLLRLVLENSDKKYNALEDEVRQIELYIQLEHERFEHKFSYSIQVDEKLKDGVYEIPSMMIQPLVENAIIHGVMNRSDNQGKVILVLSENKGQIKCSVKDNGPGIEKAREIKSKKEKRYSSMAILNIKQRLSIFENESNERAIFEIHDLQKYGKQGTEAILHLPYK